MKKLICSMLCVFLCLSLYVSSAYAVRLDLNISPQQQNSDNWCWAATSSVIINFLNTYGEYVSQENIVKAVKGSLVDEGANDQEIIEALRKFNCRTSFQYYAVSFDQIVKNIQEWYSPVLTSVTWKVNNGRHAQVIHGYEQNGVDKGIIFMDPKKDEERIQYLGDNEYRNNSKFTWGGTYYYNQINIPLDDLVKPIV